MAFHFTPQFLCKAACVELDIVAAWRFWGLHNGVAAVVTARGPSNGCVCCLQYSVRASQGVKHVPRYQDDVTVGQRLHGRDVKSLSSKRKLAERLRCRMKPHNLEYGESNNGRQSGEVSRVERTWPGDKRTDCDTPVAAICTATASPVRRMYMQ